MISPKTFSGEAEGRETMSETFPKMIYTPVIKHSNGKSPFSIGNTSSKGSFSIAMFDYQRVAMSFGMLPGASKSGK